MKRGFQSLIPFALLLMAAPLAFALSADDVVGVWAAENGGAQVEVYKDAQDKYHGKIVWLQEPLYPEGHPDEGKPKTDRANPDRARRHDPIIGLNLFYGFTFDNTDSWTGGFIYDAHHGKTYDSVMTRPDADTLHVRGYVGLPAFGKTTVWKRVPENQSEEQTRGPGE